MAAYCRKCGKPISFVMMRSGKYMPVNSQKVWCVKNPYGSAWVITPAGQLMRASEAMKGEPGAIVAYFPHWATCTGAKEIKREQQERAAQAAEKIPMRAEPERPQHQQLSFFGG